MINSAMTTDRFMVRHSVEILVHERERSRECNGSRSRNTLPVTSAVMTTVGRVVAAAIGLQVAAGAAPLQREIAARPAFEAATIKLAAGPSRANVVAQPAPNRLSIPG